MLFVVVVVIMRCENGKEIAHDSAHEWCGRMNEWCLGKRSVRKRRRKKGGGRVYFLNLGIGFGNDGIEMRWRREKKKEKMM